MTHKASAHRAVYYQQKLDYNWPTVAHTYLHYSKYTTIAPEKRRIYKKVYDILVHTDYGDGKSPDERKATVGK